MRQAPDAQHDARHVCSGRTQLDNNLNIGLSPSQESASPQNGQNYLSDSQRSIKRGIVLSFFILSLIKSLIFLVRDISTG